MTYQAIEASQVSGKPVELYKFDFPEGIETYTSAPDTQNLLGYVWEPLPIDRSPVKSVSTVKDTPLTIKVPKGSIIARSAANSKNSRVKVWLYRHHRGDSDVYLQGVWYLSTTSTKETHVSLECVTVAQLLETSLPRYHYQTLCNHELYSSECGVSPVFLTGIIQAVGKVLPDGSTDYRYLTLDINVPAEAVLGGINLGVDWRMVTEASGGTEIQVSEPFYDAKVGDTVKLHDRGCDRSYATCRDRFANNENFGGHPIIPTRNFFSGGF